MTIEEQGYNDGVKSALIKEAALPRLGMMAARLGRRAVGVDPSTTVGAAFKAQPIRQSLRSLTGPMIDHKKKIMGGLIALPLMKPTGEAIGNVMNFNDDVYRKARTNMSLVGKDLDRSTYNSIRNKTLWEATRQLFGRAPKMDSLGISGSAVKNYGVPAGKEILRQAITGSDQGIKFDSWASYFAPQRNVLMNNQQVSKARERLANSIFTPRSGNDIVMEGSKGMAKDLKADPDRLIGAGKNYVMNYGQAKTEDYIRDAFLAAVVGRQAM